MKWFMRKRTAEAVCFWF